MILVKISNSSQLVAFKVAQFLGKRIPGKIDQTEVEVQVILKRIESLSLHAIKGKIISINHPNFEKKELISDQGITYNTKKYKMKSDNFLLEAEEAFPEHLFEQFKQFILFQKMMEERK